MAKNRRASRLRDDESYRFYFRIMAVHHRFKDCRMNTMKKTMVFIALASHVTLAAFAASSLLSPEREKQYQQILLEEVNHYRRSKGLNALALDEGISHQAKQHSLDMAEKKMTFGHQDFDKRIVQIKKNLSAFGGGAENIAYFKLPPQAVVKKWLTSPGHKRNIEGRYNLTGIGIIQDKKGWIYYTQIFIKDNANKQG